jgi:hypothetical protein
MKFQKISKNCNIDTPNKQIQDCSVSWFGAGISIKRGGVKLVSLGVMKFMLFF